MSTIIAGRLQLQEQVEEAIQQLRQAGFVPEKITSFYVNPPGQHAVYPIGGDRFNSPGSEEIEQGMQFGEKATAVTEAIIGSQVTGKKEGSEHTHHRALRKAGMLVAVQLAEQDPIQVANLFKKLGADDIEQTEGEIVDGEWRDFDPLSEPRYL